MEKFNYFLVGFFVGGVVGIFLCYASTISLR